jgi:hypothetical protein
MINRSRKWILFVILAPVALAVFLFVAGVVVQQLWNWLLPSLFGLPEITFWQAWGLLVLCRILFGGFGMHGGPRSRRGWRREHMTAEERERIRDRWCGGRHADTPVGETKPL